MICLLAPTVLWKPKHQPGLSLTRTVRSLPSCIKIRTLQLWKKGNGKKGFSKKELNPVQSVNVSEDKRQVTISLTNGEQKNISFE